MGDKTIKISESILELVRSDAARESRTISEQVEHYITIGRSIARSPDFDRDHVEEAMMGGIEVGELSLEEQNTFFELFAQKMERPGASHSYWEDRKRRGLGVGETDDGQLVRQMPDGAVAAYA